MLCSVNRNRAARTAGRKVHIMGQTLAAITRRALIAQAAARLAAERAAEAETNANNEQQFAETCALVARRLPPGLAADATFSERADCSGLLYMPHFEAIEFTRGNAPILYRDSNHRYVFTEALDVILRESVLESAE
jgi:hypothetical protein